MIADLVADHAKKIQSIGVTRIGTQDLLVNLSRLLEVAGQVVLAQQRQRLRR